MTAAELFALPSDPNGVDRWLFSGELVERHNRNRFHSPGHASAVMAISALLGGWSRIAGAGRFRAYGYGCPYLLGREPDTVLSFDASPRTTASPDESGCAVRRRRASSRSRGVGSGRRSGNDRPGGTGVAAARGKRGLGDRSGRGNGHHAQPSRPSVLRKWNPAGSGWHRLAAVPLPGRRDL